MALDSAWAYQPVTITDPAAGANSAWAYTTVTILPPHHPIAVLTATGLRYVPILTWDGTTLR